MKKIFLLLLLCSCGRLGLPTPENRVKNISYYKDPRTGLCFVDNEMTAGQVGVTDDIFSYVPCTPEVEKLIGK